MKYQYKEKTAGVYVQGIGVTNAEGVIETDKEINNPNFSLIETTKKEVSKEETKKTNKK